MRTPLMWLKIMYPDPESRPLTFVPSVPLLNVFDGPLSLSVYAVRLELSCFINFFLFRVTQTSLDRSTDVLDH